MKLRFLTTPLLVGLISLLTYKFISDKTNVLKCDIDYKLTLNETEISSQSKSVSLPVTIHITKFGLFHRMFKDFDDYDLSYYVSDSIGATYIQAQTVENNSIASLSNGSIKFIVPMNYYSDSYWHNIVRTFSYDTDSIEKGTVNMESTDVWSRHSIMINNDSLTVFKMNQIIPDEISLDQLTFKDSTQYTIEISRPQKDDFIDYMVYEYESSSCYQETNEYLIDRLNKFVR